MSWRQRRFDEVGSGRTGLVLYLEGEAGIGKLDAHGAAFAELAKDPFDFFWGGADLRQRRRAVRGMETDFRANFS